MDKFLVPLVDYDEYRHLALFESGRVAWVMPELFDIDEFKSEWTLRFIPNVSYYKIADYETRNVDEVKIERWANENFAFKGAYLPSKKTWLFVKDSLIKREK